MLVQWRILRDAFGRSQRFSTSTSIHNSYNVKEEISQVSLLSNSYHNKKPFRVLFTDIWFPISYAKWRIEEIFSFVEHFHTDILVDRSKLRGKDRFPPTYEKVADRFRLAELYDILIFDPQYNFLNKYNTEDFNGTLFNGIAPASYMLRRREYRDTNLMITEIDVISFSDYDACYHLFLMLYRQLSWIPIPSNKQWIHVYPGGGLSQKNDLLHIPNDVGIVVTQLTVFNWITDLKLNNTVVMALGGAYLQPDTELIAKNHSNTEKIGICFTQMSAEPQFKGDAIFADAINTFSKQFPYLRNKTEVYTIGRSSPIDGGISLGMMDQTNLDKFYQKSVDVYINTDTGKLLNGWPLGIEALIQGAVGVQTDPHGMNAGWGFTADEMFILQSEADAAAQIVSILVKLVQDRHLLHQMSMRSQEKIFDLLSFDKSQGKVFKAMTSRICEQRQQWESI